MPISMLVKLDEAAAAQYQTRSYFIRQLIIEKFGATSQYDTYIFQDRVPELHSDRQLAKLYDYPEQFEDLYSEISEERH